MNDYRIILIGLIFTFSSCQNEKEKREYQLSDGESKYWILREYTPKNGVPRKESKLVLKFDKNFGFMQYYNKNYVLSTDQSSSDIVLSNKWYLKNDTIINLNSDDYLIIILNQDTLKLEERISGNQFLYIHSHSNFRFHNSESN